MRGNGGTPSSAPRRQPNGYRAYTAEQVALLRAFARLIEAGERIGDLAVQPIEEVLNRSEARDIDESSHGALLAAVVSFDRDRLERLVGEQLRVRGLSGFAREVVLPLAQVVGDLWALGKIPVAAEHMASEVVVHALKAGLREARGTGFVCLAACIPGERHEWGFLASLADVQELGWQVHYLGPDLPVDDVVEAAWKRQARSVAFSASDPRLVEPQLPALTQLPARLPARRLRGDRWQWRGAVRAYPPVRRISHRSRVLQRSGAGQPRFVAWSAPEPPGQGRIS